MTHRFFDSHHGLWPWARSGFRPTGDREGTLLRRSEATALLRFFEAPKEHRRASQRRATGLSRGAPYSSSIMIAVIVAIGCGSGKVQDASAKAGNNPQPQERSIPQTQEDQPIQLAEAPEASAPADSASRSSIQGTVQFKGSKPSATAIKMSADPVCQQQHASSVYSEEVVVNDNGTLRHVFVYVKEGVEGAHPAPEEPAVLDQSGCGYKPHVLGIQVNQPLEIRNSDATLHNINAKPQANPSFNVAQPVKGMKTTKTFTKPEVMVKFKCNVHPWMSAYAGVLEHPFFSVSDETGAFSISGLPAGTYVLEAWHETYGTQTQTVSVGDSETKSVEFTFEAK